MNLYIGFNPIFADEQRGYDKEYEALKEILTTQPDKALLRLQAFLKSNKKELSPTEKLDLSEIEVFAYLYTNQYSNALKVISDIEERLKNNDNNILQWRMHYIQGSAYWHMEQGNKSLEHYLKAYEIIKVNEEHILYRASTENAIGYTSVQLGFFKEALPYLEHYLSYYLSHPKPVQLGQAYNNLGEAYFGLGLYDKAYELHLKALHIRKKNKLTFHSSYSFHNLGLLFRVRKEYDQAKFNFIKAISIRKENKFLKGVLASQLELANVYKETNELPAQKKLLKQIITNAKETQKYTTLSSAYKTQAALYQKTGEFELAFNSLQRYQETLNKVQLKINDTQLTDYMTKLSTVTKDLNILTLSKENEINELQIQNIQQRSNLIIFFSIITLIILSTFLLLLHRKRKRIQKINKHLSSTLNDLELTQKKLYESEKMSSLTILVSGVAHKINTPLGIGVTAVSHISHIVKNFNQLLKKDQVKKSTFIEFTENLDKGCSLALSNMDRVADLVSHFKLLSTQFADDKQESFYVLPLLQKQSNITFANITVNKPDVIIQGSNVELLSYPSAMKKVIDHLFSNSLEHGFQEQETPKIMVTVEVNGDHIEIIYQDNGKGLTKSEANKVFDPFYTTKMGSDNVGLGLSVTYNLITQLMQGSITCDASNDGIALFKITLPITTNSIT